MPKGGPMKSIAEISFIAFGLWIAVPINCSVFPQMSQIRVQDLEEDVRKNVSSKHSYLVYNKGL